MNYFLKTSATKISAVRTIDGFIDSESEHENFLDVDLFFDDNISGIVLFV